MKENNKRIVFIWVFFAILIIILIGRLFFIQVLKNKELKDKALKIHRGIKVYNHPRGTIFDRDGQILATNKETASIYANPNMIKKEDIEKITSELNIPREALFSKKEFVWLKRRVPIELAERIKSHSTDEKIKKNSLNISGIDWIIEHKRYYPKSYIGGSLLGFVQLEDDPGKIEGLSGIERAFDKYLASKPSFLKIDKDGRGRILYTEPKFKEDPKGYDLFLAISSKLQFIAEDELKKTIDEYSADGGVVIIGYPKTGEILACASYPQFDPEVYSSWNPSSWKNIRKEDIKNKGVSWVIEPGSLFKPIIASILLQEKLIKPEDMFFCKGTMKIKNRIITCVHNHGLQSFKDVIKNSCNIGMAQAIQKLEDKKLLWWLSQFGFGKKTEIGLIEEEGIIPKGSLSEIKKANISFGYGISATPLQIFMAMSIFCTDGLLLSPIIVRSVSSKEKIIKEWQPTPIREVLSRDVVNIMKEMMFEVVENGTGKNARIEGYEICGKTGTAEKAISGCYDPSRVISSFIGFFPKDSPEILILVMIDEPKKAHYASIVAAPCFKRIAERVIFLEKIRCPN